MRDWCSLVFRLAKTAAIPASSPPPANAHFPLPNGFCDFRLRRHSLLLSYERRSCCCHHHPGWTRHIQQEQLLVLYLCILSTRGYHSATVSAPEPKHARTCTFLPSPSHSPSLAITPSSFRSASARHLLQSCYSIVSSSLPVKSSQVLLLLLPRSALLVSLTKSPGVVTKSLLSLLPFLLATPPL
ncbi:hypothetical protein F5884DRAFT_109653 [Xylogone sp. PMI_703]|nr:hypothetical protein F5884DRAFT_109653 [Xylogone sp. PMI_703]